MTVVCGKKRIRISQRYVTFREHGGPVVMVKGEFVEKLQRLQLVWKKQDERERTRGVVDADKTVS